MEGTFCQTKLPTVKGYVISGIVQFNESTKHFRSIRMLGKDTTIILDGETSTKHQGTDERERITYSKDWINYIISVKRYFNHSGTQSQVYDGPTPQVLNASHYEHKLFGGALGHVPGSSARVIHWNVHSINKHKKEKL